MRNDTSVAQMCEKEETHPQFGPLPTQTRVFPCPKRPRVLRQFVRFSPLVESVVYPHQWETHHQILSRYTPGAIKDRHHLVPQDCCEVGVLRTSRPLRERERVGARRIDRSDENYKQATRNGRWSLLSANAMKATRVSIVNRAPVACIQNRPVHGKQ